ncbi:MAG TPA: hypothetical protein VF552_11935 [Allosphingosinicella sp.]|jgi:hypothetical protein
MTRHALRTIVGSAPPPRWSGCGMIVDEGHRFCLGCRSQFSLLGAPRCAAPKLQDQQKQLKIARLFWIGAALMFGSTAQGASGAASPAGGAPIRAEPASEVGSCPPRVLPFRAPAHIAEDLTLSGRSDVLLRHVDALVVPQTETFKFRVFNPFNQTGILRDGCAFETRWAVRTGPDAHGEIRMLGPVESLGREHRYLRLPPAPEPAWRPAFEGFRHFMSSPLYIGSTEHLGIWHHSDGSPGTLVALYGAEGAPVVRLGVAARTYEGVYYFFSVHQFMFTLVDEPNGAEPLYMVTFEKVPPANCCRSPRRRR